MFSSSTPLLHQVTQCHSHCLLRRNAIRKLISVKASMPLLNLLFSPQSNAAITLTSFHLITSLPSLALDSTVPQQELVPDKVTLESILQSIDDFFNRNPFFVAGCVFIWLVVIPLTEEYLRKYKYLSTIDGFRKLRDDPTAQLLDIRDKKSVVALEPPDLEVLKKCATHVEFEEGNEGEFVRRVVKSFQDPKSTVLCIMDNFDGNSLRAAEMLFKEGGFKEAYAMKGGIRGKNGWLAIQETLLPSSVQMYPKKKKKKIASQPVDSGSDKEAQATTSSRSPYPNYPDLKPPSSPSSGKPRH